MSMTPTPNPTNRASRRRVEASESAIREMAFARSYLDGRLAFAGPNHIAEMARQLRRQKAGTGSAVSSTFGVPPARIDTNGGLLKRDSIHEYDRLDPT